MKSDGVRITTESKGCNNASMFIHRKCHTAPTRVHEGVKNLISKCSTSSHNEVGTWYSDGGVHEAGAGPGIPIQNDHFNSWIHANKCIICINKIRRES
jgi:hypothetical protein